MRCTCSSFITISLFKTVNLGLEDALQNESLFNFCVMSIGNIAKWKQNKMTLTQQKPSVQWLSLPGNSRRLEHCCCRVSVSQIAWP